MGAEDKMPGTEVGADRTTRARPQKAGYLNVAEPVSDRAAAPSPFGDDVEFPLPVEELTYTRSTTP